MTVVDDCLYSRLATFQTRRALGFERLTKPSRGDRLEMTASSSTACLSVLRISEHLNHYMIWVT